jgi:CP family cyanate transporter-like MFS transporter
MKRATIDRRTSLLIVGILLISTCLRAPITSIAPLLKLISDNFGLSATVGGLLTTLPLLAFGAVSPFAVILARAYGLERMLFCALLLIIAGVAVRTVGPVSALFLGTVVIGSGIAIGNVLLPSLLKRDFPDSVATFTAAYSLTMGIAAAIASALATPLAQLSDSTWRLATGVVVLLPVLSAAVWLPQLTNRSAPTTGTAVLPHRGRVWSSMLAWQVTLFLGLNSFVYYSGISWLPTILRDTGYSIAEAGSLHGVLQLAGASASVIVFPMIRWMKDQRLAALASSAVALGGLLGLLLAPQWAATWMILFGLGTGAGIIVGLSLVSLRASNVQQAAELSGMAQSVGYFLAAIGPLLTGSLHDIFGKWDISLMLCALLCVAMALFGLLAGRAMHIPEVSR